MQELIITKNNLKEFDPEDMPNLKKLDLSNNKIKFTGVLKISIYLKYNPVMSHLILDNN